MPLPPTASLKRFRVTPEVDHWPEPGAARLVYYAATQGYGLASEFSVLWLVNGKKLTKGDCDVLRAHAESRIAALGMLYVPVATSAGTTLKPRRVYSLIEQSEKVISSDALGSAFGVAALHDCLTRRGLGSLRRVYHRRLRAAADSCSAPVKVVPSSASPDYLVSVAVNPGHLEWHVLETKGGAHPSYGEIKKGIAQARSVQKIDGAPTSGHWVAVSGHCQPMGVAEKVVCTDVLKVKNPNGAAHAAIDDEAGLALDGAYLAAMATFFHGVRHRSAHSGNLPRRLGAGYLDS